MTDKGSTRYLTVTSEATRVSQPPKSSPIETRMEHDNTAMTGPPTRAGHNTDVYNLGLTSSTLINAKLSLRTLVSSDITGIDHYKFQESHLQCMRVLWAETPPTSRYHYRIRRRVEEWFITISQVRDFAVNHIIKHSGLEEAQYQEIVRLRIAVHSNQDKGQVINDRMIILVHAGLDTIPAGSSGDPPIESIDFMSIRAAHVLLVAAWNSLGRELQEVRRVEGLDHIFGSGSLTEDETHLSVAISAYWLAEVDLAYGELYSDQPYHYTELFMEGC
ncbi:uncharacterized protein LAJ45_03540 [Morchella importuna]|uniref:uncharacterized protein n=1 Tax=Morchella importuna TaxID=1174673 RepID=UPI001E8EAF3F|nr:uncharacterized protein LAJ45_03540 [Morchella importuna]KAH8152698.1 hypothetical protein LAJ45_03540 [Morchella importuna]